MDIVERLRSWVLPTLYDATLDVMDEAADEIERLRAIMETLDVMDEAADEIERLRGVMEKVADVLYDKGDHECWAALRNALWQEGEKNDGRCNGS